MTSKNMGKKMKLFLSMMMLMMATTVSAQDFSFDEVTYTPEATTFRLFAPKNAKAKVEYQTGNKTRCVKMKYGKDGIWTLVVKGNLNHAYYNFIAGKEKSVGVFAKAVGVNGTRGFVLDMKETNPEGWENDHRPVTKSPADLVIYEMHHRDFSIDPSSGIKHKGKFLALTDRKAIAHLKKLGINAVHILPSYDFGSIDEEHLADNKYNWGYDPVNYNVPEGSYSTDPYNPVCRIMEFKQMVQALHQAGIRVILDVVYNHTYDIDHSNFQKTYPDYYYRKTKDGAYSNGSGCGNETASNQPLMRRFMIESVKYWINEYHIDGFRFDLMGIHDIETMNQIRKAVDEIDPTVFIYGEGWSAGGCGIPNERLGMKANIPQMPRIAAFSDEIRDALRGPFDNDKKPGILGGAPNLEESVKFGIVGCIAHPQVNMSKVNYSKKPWAVEPTQMMSYVSCHDDMCLVDRLRASVPGITQDELIRLDLLAQTAVFTSQGVPFMLSGEELLRDKKDVHNSYESPDSINQLDWQNKIRYPQVFEYYKNLIKLRKKYPHFRLGSADLVRKNVKFLDAPKGVVAFIIQSPLGRADDHVVVVLNFTKKEQCVSIPDSKYLILAASGVIDLNGMDTLKGESAVVAPQSALILED